MGLMVSSELFEDGGRNDHIVMESDADSDVFKPNVRKPKNGQNLCRFRKRE